MPHQLKNNYNKTNPYTVAALGDSLTENLGAFAVPPEGMWPAVLAGQTPLAATVPTAILPSGITLAGKGLLRQLGGLTRERNFGKAGDTTTNMIARQAIMSAYDVPAIAVLWGGVNDVTTVATVTSTTVFTVSTGTGARFSIGNFIDVGGRTSVVSGVSSDQITVSPALSGTPNVGDYVIGPTKNNIQTILTALANAGCTRLIAMNTQYKNYTAGGDTTGTPEPFYAALRAYQASAVSTWTAPAGSGAAVVLCDVYAFMKSLITGGYETQGSNSWHAVANNQHLNALGESYVALAVLATIQAQSGWLAALQV